MGSIAIEPDRVTGSGPPAESLASSPLSRRRVLRVAGGAGAFLAVAIIGGGTVRAINQGVFAAGEGPAYAAWQEKNGDGPMNLVQAAVLAANAHDTQPWLFRLQPGGIDLYADTARNLGAVDPFGRELVISLGCALENLLLSAAPNGFMATSTFFPSPADPNHVAHIDLQPGKPVTSALYEAIPSRHTNRAGYTDVSVPPESLTAMANLNDAPDVAVVWLSSPEEKQSFSEVTIKATEAFIADTEQSTDSFAWWRGDWDEVQQRKDGITIDATGLPALSRAIGKMMPDFTRAQNDETWLKTTREPQLSTAAAFGIVVARDHRAAAQRLQVGRLYQRLHLWATDQGLAMQPINQMVERRDRELSADVAPEIGRALAELLPEPGWHAMMPFRIGLPQETALKSPRRPAEDVVLT